MPTKFPKIIPTPTAIKKGKVVRAFAPLLLIFKAVF
jgi:hypothetical protein